MNTTNMSSNTADKFEDTPAHKSSDRLCLKKRDERLFQVLFFLSFPMFLAFVCATRLLPISSASSDNKKQISMLSEARESAHSTIALALAD